MRMINLENNLVFVIVPQGGELLAWHRDDLRM
jgi:hypothetical protein